MILIFKDKFLLSYYRSESGYFSIDKDQLICGSIYWVQRNEKIFENPNTFKLERFSEKPELNNYMCAFSSPDPHNHFHKCLGEYLSLEVLKVVYSLLVHTTIIPKSTPKWTGNDLTRLTASDKPFQVKRFDFNAELSGLEDGEIGD